MRLLPVTGELPKLAKRQREVWNIIEERRELPLQELIDLAGTTGATVRHLEDKGLVAITTEISERDPYAREHFLPTEPLALELQQVRALAKIKEAMDSTSLKSRISNLKSEALVLEAPAPEPKAAAAERSRVFLPSRRHRQRQDGGLSAGHRPGACNRARARSCSCRKSP